MQFLNCLLPAVACCLLFLGGCRLEADRQRSLGERQDEVLRDPFGYSPQFDRGVSGKPWREIDKEVEKEVDRVHAQ